MGIKGKSNFKDRTHFSDFLSLSSSYNTTAKNITHVQRPDGSSANSFPSGHTATAFAGAEFRQEYKDVSIWYGISGYVVATGTGFFRMYNDRHWLTDVAVVQESVFYVPKPPIGCIQNAKLLFKKKNVSYDCSFFIMQKLKQGN
jgi:hypothetical protein